MVKLRDFVSSLKSVEKVEFLPYHTMGKYKWLEYGDTYELDGVREANDEDVERAKEIFLG